MDKHSRVEDYRACMVTKRQNSGHTEQPTHDSILSLAWSQNGEHPHRQNSGHTTINVIVLVYWENSVEARTAPYLKTQHKRTIKTWREEDTLASVIRRIKTWLKEDNLA